MAKFHVKAAFAIEGRPHFVLSGTVVEGGISPGMLAHVAFNSEFGMEARIDCIEFARQPNGLEDTCLCIRVADAEELDFWLAMNLEGQVVEVSDGVE